MSELICKTCGQSFDLNSGYHRCPGLFPDIDALQAEVARLTAERDALRNEIANLSVWSQKAHPDQQLVDLAHVLAILDTLNRSTSRDETAG